MHKTLHILLENTKNSLPTLSGYPTPRTLDSLLFSVTSHSGARWTDEHPGRSLKNPGWGGVEPVEPLLHNNLPNRCYCDADPPRLIS